MNKKFRIKKGVGFPTPFTLQSRSPQIVSGRLSYSDWVNEKTIRLTYDTNNEYKAFLIVQKKLGVNAPII